VLHAFLRKSSCPATTHQEETPVGESSPGRTQTGRHTHAHTSGASRLCKEASSRTVSNPASQRTTRTRTWSGVTPHCWLHHTVLLFIREILFFPSHRKECYPGSAGCYALLSRVFLARCSFLCATSGPDLVGWPRLFVADIALLLSLVFFLDPSSLFYLVFRQRKLERFVSNRRSIAHSS
jgi:hypothetical protein